jgi:predicted ATPase/DNA-binding SARP family transcriptional activator
MSELRFFLFGTPHLECDGAPVKMTRRKTMALLAYLAVTGQPHSREAITTLLWPDFDAESTYAYLRNALWMLRQTPLADWVGIEQETLAFRQDRATWVDVACFEAALAARRAHPHPEYDVCEACIPLLEEAVALYQGDFMAGFTLEDSAAFDEWQFFQAEALRRAFTDALEKLTLWYGQRGPLETALDYARRWQSLDPLHEGAQRSLMNLYAQSGQRATALHLYETLIRDLRAQGLTPSEETVALYQHIRAGDVAQVSRPLEITSSNQSSGVLPLYNLPTPATAFVERTAELAELHRLLSDPEARLITLTGPGGIGKTRLSLHAAEASLATFPDGVFFVPLAAVETPDLIVSTIADVLGLVLYQQSAAAPLTQLMHHLHEKRMLLVLDNLEQALSGAPMLAELVQRTRTLRLLVTSRERLNVQGEWVLELRGLRCPEATDIADAATYGAVQLFVERARRISHAFAPDAEDMAAIVRICRLVEGMPLGLELAAAWTRLLSCREIADEIAVSLDFLTLALRDLPERHQSLRAVFARSWSLLAKEEQACYCALSVFRGGFTRAAAAAVSGASLPLLASLIDKSMLYRAAPDRYDILHVLRQYAEEQLATTPELSDAVRDLHSDYYLDWLRRLEPTLKGPGKDVAFGQLAALDTIQTDRENIHAAWHWAVAQGRTESLHAAAFSLGMFCDIRSRFRESLELSEGAITMFSRPGIETASEFLGLLLGIQGECLSRLAMPGALETMQRSVQVLSAAPLGPELALVNVLSSYGATWYTPEEMECRLNDSLDFYRATHDLWGMALTLGVIGEVLELVRHHNCEAARSHTRQSLDIRRQTGDLWGMAIALYTLGMIAESEELFLEARQCYQESLEVRQALKDVNGAAYCTYNVGRMAYWLGDWEIARQLQLQSLTLLREIGAVHGRPEALAALAQIACDEGALAEARDFLSEACATYRAMGAVGQPLAFALLRLGNLCLELADVEAARGYLEESLALFEQFGPPEGREQVLAGLQQVENVH